MEKWEKYLYGSLGGVIVIALLVSLLWVGAIRKRFSEDGAPGSSAVATTEGQSGRERRTVPGRASGRERPTAVEESHEDLDLPGVRPLKKKPVRQIRQEDGSFERKGIITEEDICYVAEYATGAKQNVKAEPVPIFDEKPYIAWKAKLGGSVCGTPVISGEHLYLPCYDYQVVCLDRKTGRIVSQEGMWSQPVGNACAYADTIVVAQRDGTVTAFDTKREKRKWNHKVAAGAPKSATDIFISGIAVLDTRVYVSWYRGSLFVLKAADGLLDGMATVPYESHINLPAVSCGRDVLFCNVAGEIMCFDKAGSANKWKYSIEKGYPLTMKFECGKILVATTEKEFFALAPSTKQVLWRRRTAGWAFDALAVEDDRLFLAAGSLYSFDASGGAGIWECASTGKRGFCRGAPVVDGDFIYACEEEGCLKKIGKESGSVADSYEIGAPIRNGIAKAGNLVFVSTADKEILAIDVTR